uniref:Uncharacterized protein n=1 Tax=Tanacetum cinerariifolium TaxID=118510 RepID=A0A6L2J8K0_TANCI|nr:hypothetical protein [Tanacetum cinerariifolium]
MSKELRVLPAGILDKGTWDVKVTCRDGFGTVGCTGSKPNRKLPYDFIINGLYVRRIIPERGDLDLEFAIAETFHEQTDDELTYNEEKQMEANDQAIQIILMGLPEDIYAAVDSCETTQEIWLRVQQMMKGSDIEAQEKRLSYLMNRKGLLLQMGNLLNLTIIVS